MEFIEYIEKVHKIIAKNHSNPDTIENYLAAFADQPLILEETKKSSILAEQYRVNGNDRFSCGDHFSAAMLYTTSLMHAPPNSKSAALAYANRSAVSYHVKCYKECVTDVEKALDLPYPENLKQKIISRKNAALQHIKEDPSASDKKNDDLKCARGENATLPGVSNGIKIAHGVREGRSLVAKVPFRPGDVLLIDKPYLTAPDLNADPAFCHHCLKITWYLIPCDECTQRVYCSEKCLAEAFDKYHRVECKIVENVAATKLINKQIILALVRCIVILTEQGDDFQSFYKDFEDTEKNLGDPAKLGFTGDRYIPEMRRAFLSLPVKELKRERKAILFEAAYVITLLRNFTDFFKKNADITRVAKLLVKVNVIYTLNHFPIRYLGSGKAKAYGIYPLTGLMNHACTNNTIAYIDNNERLVLRASQYIKPGDQIQYNYRNLYFAFDGQGKKSGRYHQCKRKCGKCEKTYTYPSEREPQIKIDKKFTKNLMKNPYDIESLWKLLNLLEGKNQRYSYQVQMLKEGIVDAYEESDNQLNGLLRFSLMGIV